MYIVYVYILATGQEVSTSSLVSHVCQYAYIIYVYTQCVSKRIYITCIHIIFVYTYQQLSNMSALSCASYLLKYTYMRIYILYMYTYSVSICMYVYVHTYILYVYTYQQVRIKKALFARI